MAVKTKDEPSSSSTKFATHAKEARAGTSLTAESKGLTVIGKILLFLALPTLVGLGGLYVGYLKTIREPDRELKIESDFAMPFMLTVTLVIVIGLQTQGYANNKVEPIVKWPKTRKQRKIIHKHIVKGQDPNSVPDEVDEDDAGDGEGPKKDNDAKKTD